MNNQEITSRELIEASVIPSSITHVEPKKIDVDNLKKNLEYFLTEKNRDLQSPMDYGSFRKTSGISGVGATRDFMLGMRDYLIAKYEGDTTKNLTIRKNFDIILLVLDNLLINGTECSAEEMYALMGGFITRNLL